MALEDIEEPKPFQAEYEGSIPFTRSISPIRTETLAAAGRRASMPRQMDGFMPWAQCSRWQNSVSAVFRWRRGTCPDDQTKNPEERPCRLCHSKASRFSI
jgi:hypothetical protein